jgi:hypothetical protein
MPGTYSGKDVFEIVGAGGGGGFSANYGQGLFGDGIEGNVTITGLVGLTKETYYDNLTITSTGRLKPAGYRFFVKGTLTIDAGGSIDDDGNLPSGATGGLVLNARNSLGAAGGSGGGGSTGGNGSTGGGTGGNSSLNDAGLAPLGGKGGDVPIGNVGGNPGTAPSPVQGQRFQGSGWNLMSRFTSGTTTVAFNGGSGGGGGSSSAATVTGGGGGGGAGGVWCAAKTVINNGRISANGANGAPGFGTTGDAGGGGGGGGGFVCVAALSITGTGQIQALGGTGGAGYNNGDPGANGNAGSTQVVVLA